jgi:hypothetical protein
MTPKTAVSPAVLAARAAERWRSVLDLGNEQGGDNMSLLLIILLILLLGGGGFGYHTWGPIGGGISVGTVLVIILVLYLLGAL